MLLAIMLDIEKWGKYTMNGKFHMFDIHVYFIIKWKYMDGKHYLHVI